MLQGLNKIVYIKHLGYCLAYKGVFRRLEDDILAPTGIAYTSDTTAN